jgi:ParB family chromosome partitioning protein
MKYIKSFTAIPEQLFPNPKNPRKNVGDITELTESIKENGIMQELTVVPMGGTASSAYGTFEAYTVVIGHRRLAAAKKAGLREIPVKVYEMSRQEIQAMMLTENMQRSDLTTYEEANGIQMCLDLGMSDEDVSKQTGLSKTTVKNRTIILKYKNAESDLEEGRTTIQDYINLEKIKNQDDRNKLEKSLGTSNFNWEFEQALSLQEFGQELDKAFKKLKKLGVKEKTSDDCNYYNNVQCVYQLSRYGKGKKEIVIPELDKDKEYEYEATESNFVIYLMEKPPVADHSKDNWANKFKKESDLNNNIRDAFSQAQKLRIDYENQLVHMSENEIAERFGKNLVTDTVIDMISANDDGIDYISGMNDYLDYSFESSSADDIKKRASKRPMQLSLAMSLIIHEYNADLPLNYPNEYDPIDKSLQELYSYLNDFGYKTSETELKLLNGTYEAYKKEDK